MTTAAVVIAQTRMENLRRAHEVGHALRAERDATVAKIHAKEGDSLAVDAVILEFA